MFGPASRCIGTVLLLVALAAPAMAMPVSPGTPPLPPAPSVQGPDATAPDAEQATGWTLRQEQRAEDRTGVQAVDAAKDATQPALDDATDLYAALRAALGDPLGYLDHEVVDPIEDTAGLAVPILDEPTDEAEPETAPAAESAQPLLPPVAQTLIVAGAAAAGTFLLVWLTGSSGTLGAAGTAAGAKAAGTDLRRLLPFASPLFTRFEKDTVLGHPKREALYALIMQSPGVSLQALGEATGLSRTAVAHHLRLLELQHLVVSKRHGRSRHYFENGGRYGREQKDAYAVLQNDRSKAVADYVRDHPGAIQKELCVALGLQASITHWHVRRLQEALLVESVRKGRTVSYFPTVGLRQVGATEAAVPALPTGALA